MRLFVGRAGELADLERALADGPGVVVQAVHGLGGIGKSALAARYALLHAGEYTQVVWASAEDPAGIEASLGRFAIALEPQLDGILSPDALAERATAWLAAHDQWLLILDNVNSVNDVAPLLARLDGGSGRFLATSRRATGWHHVGAAALRLGVFEPGEALVLLAGILPHRAGRPGWGRRAVHGAGVPAAGHLAGWGVHGPEPPWSARLSAAAGQAPGHLTATGGRGD